ncbi:MAG: undecaprenyl-diphosphate phosphatase [Clostridia bacterium]|nr:undecaprenyl-diphosphate phosphatase [Clostridia bacterium]
MTIFEALILGLIQGLTEFLPISSSGHLTLAEAILGINNSNNYFNILLHLATLLSVLIVLYKDVLVLIRRPFSKTTLKVVLATLITCVGAALLKIFIPKLFEVGFLGFGFLLSGMLMLVCFLPSKNTKTPAPSNEVSFKSAIIMGISGCFAVLPGVSRSGTSICAGVLANESKENSVKFSFLISIPIIIASMVFEIFYSGSGVYSIGFLPCLVGAISAFLSSLVSIKFMLKIAKKGNWIYFAIYLLLLSFGVLIYTFAF